MIETLQKLVERSEHLTSINHPKGLLIEGSDLTPILATD